MKLSFVQPRAELEPCIESFWVFESPIGMPLADRSMAAPNGCAKLIIPYENSLTSVADGRVQVSREQGLYFVGNRDTSSARNFGFAAAIEGILADLRTREDLPWSLLNIVGEEPPIPDGGDPSASVTRSARADGEVLLSKPANPEQVRIARQLEEHGGVLVQGPPGTGNTHTIGNLVGHLQAQGKSVLVTSHATKALRMIRHHIVPELRPLCVSVLESDLDSRKQLESAVGSIAERLSRADARSLEMAAKKLESQRLEVPDKLDEIRNQLTEARADECRDIVIGGKSWAPAEAARHIVQEKEGHGWIPGPVAAVAPPPLSPGELGDLYRTSASISREDETELSGHLPELHDLPSADDFEGSVNERNWLRMEDLELRPDLWGLACGKICCAEWERPATFTSTPEKSACRK